jgi:hypothetical protein
MNASASGTDTSTISSFPSTVTTNDNIVADVTIDNAEMTTCPPPTTTLAGPVKISSDAKPNGYVQTLT